MADRKTLCQLYQPDTTGRLPDGHRAMAQVEVLPRALHRDDHVIHRGYAVEFGQWMFFPAIEPALVFGRAARMSLDCSSYGVYEAAQEVKFCDRHGDERVLLIKSGDRLDRQDNEVELLKRFVQGVKEHPWSAHWHEPTGYITEYNEGNPIQTRRRSLPL